MKGSFILLFFVTFLACNNTPSNQQATASTSESLKEVNVQDKAFLPSLTVEKIKMLWETCNQMDYIFYELPISSSVDDSPSAQAHLRHISDAPVRQNVKERCGKAIGRIFYKSAGEDIMNAEVFFSGGCAFFVFYEAGKASYCNLMTPDGVNHFNQLIAAVSGVSPSE